jgi:hypothetical protein
VKSYENVKAAAVVSDLPKVLAAENEAEDHYLTEVTVALAEAVVVVVVVVVALVVLVALDKSLNVVVFVPLV